MLKALLQGQPDSRAALWKEGASEALHGLPAMLTTAVPAQLSRPRAALALQATVTCILEVGLVQKRSDCCTLGLDCPLRLHGVLPPDGPVIRLAQS